MSQTLNQIFPPYADLLRDLERLGSALDQVHAEHLNCRAGCADCCQQHLGIFAVEVAALRSALTTLPPAQQVQIRAQAQAILRGERQACPLLQQERCSVYHQRPVICRTHGYPLHYLGEEEGEIYLDVCPLNFTAEGALDRLVQDEASLAQTLPLDRLNLRLAAINQVYCRDLLQDLEQASQRLPLAELVLDVLPEPDTL